MFGVEDLIKIDRYLTDLGSRPAGWADDLRSAVSLGFTRRPWDKQTPTQTVDEMIDAMDTDLVGASSADITAERGWLRGALGAVTTTCTWPELGGDNVQIIRVYMNHSGQWLCEYWQETRYHHPSV